MPQPEEKTSHCFRDKPIMITESRDNDESIEVAFSSQFWVMPAFHVEKDKRQASSLPKSRFRLPHQAPP